MLMMMREWESNDDVPGGRGTQRNATINYGTRKRMGEHDNTNERTTAPFPLFSSLISFFYLFSSSFFPLQHTNRVAVLVAKEGVCVHVYITVRRNERTSTTFLRSHLHRIAATVLINAILTATTIEPARQRHKYISVTSSSFYP
jgi:hypothetical protein